MDNQSLDNYFRKRLETMEVAPPPAVWDNILKAKTTSRKPYLYIAAAVAALLVALPFLLQKRTAKYQPRESVMLLMVDDDTISPFVLMADALDEKTKNPINKVVATPSLASTEQKPASKESFVQKKDEALNFIDSIERHLQMEYNMQRIELMANAIIDEKIRRMEIDAMMENAWHNQETNAMDNNLTSNLLPAIRKFFHPDYYLSVDLDNLPKVRLSDRN